MKPSAATMAEACAQAANLYDALAGTRDVYTRDRARQLRAAARVLEAEGRGTSTKGQDGSQPSPRIRQPRPAAPPAPRGINLEELLATVSVTIGLRERAADGRWTIDDETMRRLEAAYAPVREGRAPTRSRSRTTEPEEPPDVDLAP